MVTPMSVISRKSYGVLTRLTPSQATSAPTSTSPTRGSTGTFLGMVMGWRRAAVATRYLSLLDALGEDWRPPPKLPSYEIVPYATFTRLAGGVIVLNAGALPPGPSLYCVTGFAVVSPFALIEKLPRIPSVTLVWSRLSATFDREPPEFETAVSMTSMA